MADGKLPDKIKAVVLTGYGATDKVQVREVDGPGPPTEDQVLVRARACGLNFADIYTRQGLASERKPPFVMGLECSGVVVGTGPRVSALQVGDRVLVHTGEPGLQAEIVRASEKDCFRIPDSMSFEDAAAFPINYLTAYLCLFDIGNLRQDQTVLVPSAAGGVGWAATQLAKTVPGVMVIGTASPAKHEAVLQNGADVVIDSQDPDWAGVVRAACPRGVDVAIDTSSGDCFQKTQQLLNHLGRAILIGANSMIEGEQLSVLRVLRSWWKTSSVKPLDLITNSRSVAGLHLTNVKKQLPDRYNRALRHLMDMYQNNQIKPRIDSVWSFDQIGEATWRLSRRQNIGKVILRPPSDENASLTSPLT